MRSEKSAGQRFRRLLTLDGERLSAAVALRLLALVFDLLLDAALASAAFALVFDLLFDDAFALAIFAFVFDLLFAGTPTLILVAASQMSPMPLPSLSVCVGLDIPTQLS